VTRPSSAGAPAYSETFPREPGSAVLARLLVTAALDTWHLPELADRAELVVTELVANAADHARGSSIRVIVTRLAACRLRAAVVDEDPTKPQLRAAGSTDEHGRGPTASQARRWRTT
jgi:hypothetical protein